MLELLGLTISFTLGLLLSAVIYTVIMIAVMSNPKAIKIITDWYMKQIEKITEAFEEADIEKID